MVEKQYIYVFSSPTQIDPSGIPNLTLMEYVFADPRQSDKEIIVHFTHHCEPMPYVRIRQGQGRCYTDKRYKAYLDELSAILRKHYGHLSVGVPKTGEKGRSKWLKSHAYYLDIEVYRTRDVSDWDNYGKPVSDALEKAGVIANDKQIQVGKVTKEIDKENPRITVTLYQLKG